VLFRRLKGQKYRQLCTSIEAIDDMQERTRIVGCVREGVAVSGEVDPKSTLSSLQERSGMTLEQLVDTPEELLVALRGVFGVGSASIISSIRKEVILYAVGRAPLNGRIEAFLFVLERTKG
jgi:hypothetical protein